MPLTGPTFEPAPALNTYITVFNVAIGSSGNVVEIIGSATKTIAISRIFFTKPSGSVTLVIRKQSAASTGGTSTPTTIVPLNSTNLAATAVVNQYTVAPTPGTLVGEVYRETIATTESATVQFPVASQFQNGILNGITETFTLNVSAAATVVGSIEWAEYPS